MPKKTKKEKILADLRKKMLTLSSPSPNFVKSQNDHSKSPHAISYSSAYTYKKESAIKPNTVMPVTDYSHIKKDLIRITIFTFAALLGQGMLYFFLYRG